jgi:hypothetical protein
MKNPFTKDPFHTASGADTVIATVTTTLEVVEIDGGMVRVNIIIDEDFLNLIGRTNDVVFSAVTTMAELLNTSNYFNIELTSGVDAEWEVK